VDDGVVHPVTNDWVCLVECSELAGRDRLSQVWQIGQAVRFNSAMKYPFILPMRALVSALRCFGVSLGRHYRKDV